MAAACFQLFRSTGEYQQKPQSEFYVLLTVHPCIIFFQTKPTKCTLLLSIFISISLHVSGNYAPIIRRTYCIYATLVFFTLYCSADRRTGSSVGIATDYGLDGPGSNPRWGRDFPPFQTDPGAHPASCKMRIVSFPGVKCGRGVLLTTHPLLVPWPWNTRAIPLPTLWATPGL